jgi:3-oxoadipate enol-lactonase/4-carboxymuconolactone decarboxylase
MGGGIVQEIALRSPRRLLSLTLHNTSCKFALGGDPVMEEWREKRLALADTEGMAAVAELPAPVEPPPHLPTERLEEVKLRLSKMSADSFIGAWQGLLDWEGTIHRAQKISVPTLIIYGDLDIPGLIKGSLKLAELIPGARVAVIPETAHQPQWERPELFNRALRDHLDANAKRG